MLSMTGNEGGERKEDHSSAKLNAASQEERRQ